MGKRWVLFALVGIVLFCSIVSAHKFPVVEYTYVGHLWEEAFAKIPLQPVENEKIILKTSVVHPNDTIEGNVTVLYSIYRDDTIYEWFGGEPYKSPNWLLMKEEWGQPTDKHNEFVQDIVIGEAGSYHVMIDWYENQQYIGQSMHMLDVEKRTIGPLFYVLSVLVLAFTIIGVRAGIL